MGSSLTSILGVCVGGGGVKIRTRGHDSINKMQDRNRLSRCSIRDHAS